MVTTEACGLVAMVTSAGNVTMLYLKDCFFTEVDKAFKLALFTFIINHVMEKGPLGFL